MRKILIVLLCLACSGCAACQQCRITLQYKDVEVTIEPKY